MADILGNSTPVEGRAAHDAAVHARPVTIGGRSSTDEPTAVAVGDACHLWVDTFGRIVTVPHHPNPNVPTIITLTSTTATNILAAPGAGQSYHVTLLTATNTSATGVRLDVRAGTTVRFSHFLAASGGGYVIPFSQAWKLPANTALTAQLGAAVTDVRVTALTFTAP